MGECVLHFKYSASETQPLCVMALPVPSEKQPGEEEAQEQTTQIWVPALTLYFLLERPESDFSGPQLGQL